MSTTGGIINLSVVIATNVFAILPLAALVLYISIQRWLQSSRFTASHSDHFTYHMIVNGILNFSGLVLVTYGVNADHQPLVQVGFFIFCSNLFAQLFIDTLTCTERYLAVVHPVTYLDLKNAKGVCIRNFAIGSCWLLSIVVAGVLFTTDVQNIPFILLSMSGLSLLVVFFCSLCVLCVLVRPGPGKVREVKKVDQTKLRAFYTILIILVVMVTRLIVTFVIDTVYTVMSPGTIEVCDLIQPLFWISLPSCLIPFVLFLQREGKTCCKNNKV